jgi:hypothetical protein
VWWTEVLLFQNVPVAFGVSFSRREYQSMASNVMKSSKRLACLFFSAADLSLEEIAFGFDT